MANPSLTVPRGQLTFDAEGNDVPNSPYFSRKAHKPPGISGVTIGRGYDLGHRGSASLIRKEFKGAGMELALWEAAFGLKGNEAQAWLNANKDKLPVITHEQQLKLFDYTYNYMVAEVTRLSTKKDVAAKYGTTDFNTLNPAILDIVVDLRFRGDYSPKTRNRVQPCMVDNNIKDLMVVMSDRDYWKAVPPDRFKRRVEYLQEQVAGPRTTTADVSPVSAAAPATAPEAVEGSANSGDRYTVQPGDSLAIISRRIGAPVQRIKEVNIRQLKRWGSIEGFEAGEVISVP